MILFFIVLLLLIIMNSVNAYNNEGQVKSICWWCSGWAAGILFINLITYFK